MPEKKTGSESKQSWVQLAAKMQAAVVAQVLLIITLPIVTHVKAFEKDERLIPIGAVFWTVAGLLGAMGFVAIQSKNSVLLSAYIVSAVMCGAALAVYSLLVDYLLASSCLVLQSAYDGCQSCECAKTNTCSKGDFDDVPSCRDCQAWPTEVCKHFEFDGKSSVGFSSAFTSLVTLVASAIPATIGLVALVRKEQEEATVSARFQWIKGQVLDQCHLLESGQKPTIDGPPLMRLIRACEDYDPMLAERAKSLLAMWEAHHGTAAGWSKPKGGKNAVAPGGGGGGGES